MIGLKELINAVQACADNCHTLIGTIETRLSAARAGYLEELAAANLPTDVVGVKTVADAIAVLTDIKVMGRSQIEVEPLDLDTTGVGSYATLIATDQNIIIESLIFYCKRDLSEDAGFTGLSVETDDATPQVFISQEDGVKANLTAESQLPPFTGSILLREGQYIDFSVYGGAVANAESLCQIVVRYRAVVSGGYLA